MMCNEDLKRFVSDDNRVITLPVPLGAMVYSYHADCFDGCLFQKEQWAKVMGTSSKGQCGLQPCRTMNLRVTKQALTLSNIQTVLCLWGTAFFATADEARTQGEIEISHNKEELLKMGFSLNEKGYSVVSQVG